MINWETIKSLYNDKPTLLQWLRKVEAALSASVLQVVDVEKVSTSEIKLNFIFEDGTNIETPTIALPYEIQSVAIVNGHLILTLESGETLDAGNLGAVSGFSINAAQHLIVTYQDGTTQDLGAIFNGNVNIAGNFTADSIIENMSGYSFEKVDPPDATYQITYNYAGVCKNGNKITFVIDCDLTFLSSSTSGIDLGYFNIPFSVGMLLIPSQVGLYNFLDNKIINAFESFGSGVPCYVYMSKQSITKVFAKFLRNNSLSLNTPYHVRYEVTFLLSENLAQ